MIFNEFKVRLGLMLGITLFFLVLFIMLMLLDEWINK